MFTVTNLVPVYTKLKQNHTSISSSNLSFLQYTILFLSLFEFYLCHATKDRQHKHTHTHTEENKRNKKRRRNRRLGGK